MRVTGPPRESRTTNDMGVWDRDGVYLSGSILLCLTT